MVKRKERFSLEMLIEDIYYVVYGSRDIQYILHCSTCSTVYKSTVHKQN